MEISFLSGLNYHIADIQMGSMNKTYDNFKEQEKLRDQIKSSVKKVPFFSEQFVEKNKNKLCLHNAKVKLPGYAGKYECTTCHKFF